MKIEVPLFHPLKIAYTGISFKWRNDLVFVVICFLFMPTSDHIFVLSNQFCVLAGHMSFQKKQIFTALPRCLAQFEAAKMHLSAREIRWLQTPRDNNRPCTWVGLVRWTDHLPSTNEVLIRFWTQFHMWVEFVGSLFCSERFVPFRCCGFLLSPKTKIGFDLLWLLIILDWFLISLI